MRSGIRSTFGACGTIQRAVAVDAENLLRTSQQHGVELFVMLADVALSWARGRLGDARSGATELRRSLAEYTTKGNRLFVPPVLALLAELESAAGNAERAQSAIDEGLAMAQRGRAALYGSLPSSPPRRPPAQTQSGRSRARCSGLQDRCRGLGASGRAQLTNCSPRSRSPSSTNRPVAPPKPTPSSRLRSKASRRRRKCLRSPRRRRCWRRWRRPTRSRPPQRSDID